MTPERLGVYLPVVRNLIEALCIRLIHFETLVGTYRQSKVSGLLSTPMCCDSCPSQRGYAAEVGGDARRVHPKLRPPVSPQELEIDPATGMKVSQLIPG